MIQSYQLWKLSNLAKYSAASLGARMGSTNQSRRFSIIYGIAEQISKGMFINSFVMPVDVRPSVSTHHYCCSRCPIKLLGSCRFTVFILSRYTILTLVKKAQPCLLDRHSSPISKRQTNMAELRYIGLLNADMTR